jgi:solute carrier family 25 phosphate transporter 23/24/25/41
LIRVSANQADRACPPDFLLFLPTTSPGLKAVFNYYQTTTKLTAEGDVHMTEESVHGIGMLLGFLQRSLFGSFSQIIAPKRPRQGALDHGIAVPSRDAGAPASRLVYGNEPRDEDVSEDDPHIPLKPARRKEETNKTDALQQDVNIQLTLTDFVPELGYFIAGGSAGIVSRTSTAPLDRLKVYLIAQTDSASDAVQAVKSGNPAQALSSGGRTLWKASKELWAAGGIRSLFAGTFDAHVRMTRLD